MDHKPVKSAGETIRRLVRKMIAIACAFHFLSGITGFCSDLEPKSTQDTVEEIRVRIEGLNETDARLKNAAGDLITLEVGKPFDPIRFQASVDALKKSGWFENIDVREIRKEKGMMGLQFTLRPFPRIVNISVSGAYPVFEKEVLKVLRFRVGDPFAASQVPEQEKTVRDLFSRNGFIDPEVTITARETEVQGRVEVLVNIQPGSFTTIGQLILTGNRWYSSARLKLRMKTWTASLLPGGAGRFIQEDLDKDIKELITFYRENGFAEVAIKKELVETSIKNTIDIHIQIDEGPMYVVTFQGNKEFWDYTLEKDLEIYRMGAAKGFGIRKSISNMKKRYKKNGFPDVKITSTSEKETKDDIPVLNILFTIDEGKQRIVEAVRIHGSQAFKEKQLRKELLTRPPGTFYDGRFVPETLEEDMAALRSLYLKNGYPDVDIHSKINLNKDTGRVTVDLNIQEGVRTMVKSVKILNRNTEPSLSEKEIIDKFSLKQGEPFREYLLENDRNLIVEWVSEKGYPHVRVDVKTDFSKDRKTVNLTYGIDPGSFVRMGNVYYSGNFKTRESVLNDRFGMRNGDPFSPKKLLKSEQAIRNLDIFDRVGFRISGLKEKADQVHVFVNMEEKPPYWLQAAVGYDTEREMYIRGKAGNWNLFGLDKSGWVSGEISRIGYRADIGLSEPNLLDFDAGADVTLFTERKEAFNQDFGTTVSGATLGFHRGWSKHLNTSLLFRLERRDQFSRGAVDALENDDEYAPRTVLVGTPSISYDSRDSFIRPKKGVFSSVSVDVSKGLENSLDDFFKIRWDTRYFITPLPKTTFALRFRFGRIEPFGSTSTIPDDQIFFLGGTSDVRGFDENMLLFDSNRDPIGGSQSLYGSIEIRYEIGMNVELTGFYDAGGIYETKGEAISESYRDAAGLGLRYITPIGPVGFLYGFKLHPEEGERSGKLHFSIGYTF